MDADLTSHHMTCLVSQCENITKTKYFLQIFIVLPSFNKLTHIYVQLKNDCQGEKYFNSKVFCLIKNKYDIQIYCMNFCFIS
jgi:hypothetical protein